MTTNTAPKKTPWKRRMEREAANPELREKRLRKLRAGVTKYHAKRHALAWDIRQDILATPEHERPELVRTLAAVAEKFPSIRAAMAQYTVDHLIGHLLETEDESA